MLKLWVVFSSLILWTLLTLSYKWTEYLTLIGLFYCLYAEAVPPRNFCLPDHNLPLNWTLPTYIWLPEKTEKPFRKPCSRHTLCRIEAPVPMPLSVYAVSVLRCICAQKDYYFSALLHSSNQPYLHSYFGCKQDECKSSRVVIFSTLRTLLR